MGRVITLVDSLISGPLVPPLTEAYVKKHIKATADSENVLVASWILAAASYFEEQTGRQIMLATREAWLDAFPTNGKIELPHPPLQSVVSVLSVDGNGDVVPFTDGGSPEAPLYQVRAPQGPYAVRGWIEPVFGQTWPSTRNEAGAVRIQYTCGYGDAVEQVPDLISAILCYHVAHLHQLRAAVHKEQTGESITEVPFGLTDMLRAFKYSALPTVQLRNDWLL
jgi:uncharacterized phiE125 gp8 family phage protein